MAIRLLFRKNLGGPVAGNIAVGQNSDGRLQIFARRPNGSILTDWQNTPGGAYDWATTAAMPVFVGP